MVSQIPGVLGFLCLLPLTLIPTSLAMTSLYEDYGWQADSYATGQHFYSRSAVCVPIPEDLRLCHNVGYRDMRLPNLLEHESMQEVRQQAGAWVPLLAKRCHPDTQLLLCSLFAPVCLDRPIYPCRSLCEAVRDSCVPVMESFGFPWPEMLRCDKFPLDNDLCITAQAAGEKPPESTETKKCPPCDNEQTLESVTEHFCASEFGKCQPTLIFNLHLLLSKLLPHSQMFAAPSLLVQR
uniref:Secreted frizzled-related protein 5 n=1 Tax=Eptatretus burgeri TaxID=7764 RepID=A0A8C4QA49_EPTBU